ncbi:A disintegrin and metalloproteinase with thrombospondin motifs 9, partial [Biomphalaria glabrata]
WTYLGTICQQKDADHIAEFDGTYWTALVTAHQICKLLGSQHNFNSENRWFFPSSIASDIRNKMATLS